MRTILAVIPGLKEELRTLVAERAKALGFETLFFECEEEALPRLAEAEIVFGHTPGLAKKAPGLRWLCSPFAGVDQLTAPGVLWPGTMLSNSSGAYGVTIAEHIVMAALELLRCQPEYAETVRKREWQRGLPVRSLRGSRITLLGTGDIGREAAVRLRAFGPACLTGVSRSGKHCGLFDRVLPREQLDAVLAETDILIVSLPGTPETFHMLDARRLALLPEGAAVINVGRGSVAEQEALERELRAGRLRAALDVFEQEPLPPEHSLWTCPNLLLTPHVAGNMTLPYTRRRIAELFLEDLENYSAGRPLLRRVDPALGY